MKAILNRRKNDDRGDALLTMSIIFVSLFALCAGMAIDLSKSVYVKSSFQLMTQESTSDAARNVNDAGNLTPVAVTSVVNAYNNQVSGKASGGGEAGAISRSGACSEVEVEGVKYKAPYMEIRLEQGRGEIGSPVTYRYDPNGGLRATGGSYLPSATYHVISARVYDTAPNLLLGIFGVPCQNLVSDVSSVTFGSQQDVEKFYG